MSKKINASAFSCGVSGSAEQPPGQPTLATDDEPEDLSVLRQDLDNDDEVPAQ